MFNLLNFIKNKHLCKISSDFCDLTLAVFLIILGHRAWIVYSVSWQNSSVAVPTFKPSGLHSLFYCFLHRKVYFFESILSIVFTPRVCSIARTFWPFFFCFVCIWKDEVLYFCHYYRQLVSPVLWSINVTSLSSFLIHKYLIRRMVIYLVKSVINTISKHQPVKVKKLTTLLGTIKYRTHAWSKSGV